MGVWAVALLLHAVAGQTREDVEYYALEFEWKPAFCYGRIQCADSFKTDDFNIHSLIPYNKDNKKVLRCTNEPFHIDSPHVLKQWQPRDVRLEPEEHWSIEWMKHGTCMHTKDSPQEFFDRTLALARQFDLKQLLLDHGIFPDATKLYRKSAVLEAFGRKVGMDCSPKRGFLKYVQVFLDREFRPIEAAVEFQESQCPEEFIVPTFATPREEL